MSWYKKHADETKEKPDIVEKVETFINRIHNLELVVKPEARKIRCGDKNLSYGLSDAISKYEGEKNTVLRNVCAKICLS